MSRPLIPITTTGGQGTVVLSASGLPPNLTLTDNGDGTGEITGTIAVGEAANSPFAVTITATDDLGRSSRRVFEFTVNALTVDAIADQSVQESGGVAPTFAPALSIATIGLTSVPLGNSNAAHANLRSVTMDGAASSGTSDYLLTPYDTQVSELDIRFFGKLNDWHTRVGLGDNQDFAAGTGRTFALRNGDTGTGDTPRLILISGGSVSSFDATASHSLADGDEGGLRATWRVSDGRLRFFETTDYVTWTQIGADVMTGLSSIDTSSSPLVVGTTRNNSAANDVYALDGEVYNFDLYDGEGGALVYSFNADDAVVGATGGGAADTPGATVTSGGRTWTLYDDATVTAQPNAVETQPSFAPALSIDTIGLTVVDGENELVQPQWPGPQIASSPVVDLNAASLALSDGVDVTSWTSEGSDTGNAVVEGSSNAPSYAANGMGTGVPGVSFDEANTEALEFTLAADMARPRTIVLWQDTPDNTEHPLLEGYSEVALTNGLEPRIFTRAGNDYAYTYESPFIETTNGPRTPGTPQVLFLTIDNANPDESNLYIDDSTTAALTTTNNSGTDLLRVLLLGRLGTGAYGTSTLGRLLVYDRVLTEQERLDTHAAITS